MSVAAVSDNPERRAACLLVAFAALTATAVPLDRFGGWADGPKLNATGAFRTEKLNGKWWLVDPDGRLFFSLGVQAVNRRPEQDGNAAYYALVTNKYGSADAAGAAAVARMKEWGLNTVGPWSGCRPAGKRIPYCGHLWVGKMKVAASKGWWGKFPDPYAPGFRQEVVSQAKAQLDGWGSPSGRDPYCIGYFVNNEMSWSGDDMELARSVIRSPDGQPAKAAFAEAIRQRRGPGAALSENLPEDDLKWLENMLVEKFFRTVAEALHEVLPDKLFLGSRIAWGGETPLRACAKYADVVSVNTYRYGPRIDLPPGSADKPMLVSEFQFCAPGNGFTRTGMIAASNQADRAHCCREYVRACLEHPRYVGAHWFQWLDSPPNPDPKKWEAQSGLVDTNDVPYAGTTAAFRVIADEMYGWRSAPAVGLGPGERVEGNVYYSDVRWVRRVWGGEANALVRRHSLGDGRTFAGGRIAVRPDRWIKGEAFVEVCGDDGEWLRAGAVEKGKFVLAELPGGAFPCSVLSVRFIGAPKSSYEQNGYSLDLEFSGPPAWATSSTNAFYTAQSGAWLSPYAWTVDSLRKVPRFGAKPPRTVTVTAVRVSLAANETEAVQVVLSPMSDMRDVRIDASVDGGLEAEVLMVDWRRVTNPTDSSGVTGFWPDPIRRQAKDGAFVPRGSNRAFLVRVRAPKGTRKGTYRGELRLHEAGDDGKAQKMPLEVEVFGFELPDRMTCLTNFGFDSGKLRNAGCDERAFQAALDRHHMTRFGRCIPYKYVFDEPTTNQYPEVRALCEKSKAEHPELKRMVTEPPCPELQGHVDIWCPRTDDYSRPDAEAARARGEDYWWYICCGPKAPYAGLFIDRPGTELRTWLWQTWAEKITGVLIWHTHWWSKSRDDNGDGTFFYADSDGLPVDTVRAEAFRDGVEDYEYLAMLTRLAGRRAKVPESVARSLTDFDRTGAALVKAREQLARAIEAYVKEDR